jgi:hypothetical protein
LRDSFLVGVDRSIYFDHQFQFRALEIDDEAKQWPLSSKLEAQATAVVQDLPRLGLSGSRVSPKLPCSGDDRSARAGLSYPRHLTSVAQTDPTTGTECAQVWARLRGQGKPPLQLGWRPSGPWAQQFAPRPRRRGAGGEARE